MCLGAISISAIEGTQSPPPQMGGVIKQKKSYIHTYIHRYVHKKTPHYIEQEYVL